MAQDAGGAVIAVLAQRSLPPPHGPPAMEAQEAWDKWHDQWTTDIVFQGGCPEAWTVGQLREKISQLKGEEGGLSMTDQVRGTLSEPRLRQDAYLADDVRLGTLMDESLTGQLEVWWLPWPPFPSRPPGSQSIDIIVKTMAGQEFTVCVEGGDCTVPRLKELIRDREGVPVEDQRLIFHARQIEDNRTLSDLNMGDLSQLHLLVRLRATD